MPRESASVCANAVTSSVTVPSRALATALGILLALALTGCGEQNAPREIVRPVRIITLQATPVSAVVEFSGVVRPRIESALGFRVGGKLLRRHVDLGQTVQSGQLLAELDPRDLELSRSAARAQLSAAATERNLALADLGRYRELRAQGFISSAELERRQSLSDAAQARYDQAHANLAAESNQAAYTRLLADSPGIVTGVEAEAGQVVSAGQPVIRIARSAEKEIEFGIPEDRITELRDVRQVQVALWSRPGETWTGTVREIAASADPATRTYGIRVALPDDPRILLGMTATVRYDRVADTAVSLRLPLSAVMQHEGRTAVWRLDPATMTVQPVPVRLGPPSANDLTVIEGLQPGQQVVTAGVSLLQPSQKVKILSAESDAQAIAAAPLASARAARGGASVNAGSANAGVNR